MVGTSLEKLVKDWFGSSNYPFTNSHTIYMTDLCISIYSVIKIKEANPHKVVDTNIQETRKIKVYFIS